MAGFWPTPFAAQNMPVVAERMNNLQKVVFSRTLDNATWNNTRLVKDNMIGEIQKLKRETGEDMTIMGSGSIISQLTQHGLINEYQFVIIPVVLGKGRTMFDGITGKLPLKLTKTQPFKNGNVVLSYEPTGSEFALS
jgi:dihydrofolate reductase